LCCQMIQMSEQMWTFLPSALHWWNWKHCDTDSSSSRGKVISR
jgi:hypothetical protein